MRDVGQNFSVLTYQIGDSHVYLSVAVIHCVSVRDLFQPL